MFSDIREQISPTILAVATILVLISIALFTVIELLRRRSELIRGLTPGQGQLHLQQTENSTNLEKLHQRLMYL